MVCKHLTMPELATKLQHCLLWRVYLRTDHASGIQCYADDVLPGDINQIHTEYTQDQALTYNLKHCKSVHPVIYPEG